MPNLDNYLMDESEYGKMSKSEYESNTDIVNIKVREKEELRNKRSSFLDKFNNSKQEKIKIKIYTIFIML